MQSFISESAQEAAAQAVANIEQVDEADGDSADVELFTKMIKKAEEVTQSAV